MNTSASLRINEIFFSLQGESSTVGLPTTFVRLTGCPLRCGYCDTEYAFNDGKMMPLNDILARVTETGARYITVTGGEPLAQPGCLVLLQELCNQGFKVSLETSGAMDITHVDPRVVVVMDLKTPGSGECARNLETNIGRLKPVDEVKFVICDRRDYEWAKAKIDQYALTGRVREILVSPAFEQVAYRDLAGWVLEDRLPVRMQVQLHKIIWGDAPGH
jgi:7-carboxy-7-deazaguanine synthase